MSKHKVCYSYCTNLTLVNDVNILCIKSTRKLIAMIRLVSVKMCLVMKCVVTP